MKMKKLYIIPSVEITNTELNQMIALSVPYGGEGTDKDTGDTKQEGDWNIWSNDDEEE